MRVFCNRLAHTQAQPVEPYRLLKLGLALLLAAMWCCALSLSLSLSTHSLLEKKKTNTHTHTRAKVLTSRFYRSLYIKTRKPLA